MKAWIFLLILFTGCREFYDEEFEDGQYQSARDNVTYTAELSSTDPGLPSLSGKSVVEVRNGNVTINLELSGVPENIIQIHYGYLSSGCSAFNLSIPIDSTSTRSFTVSETSTISALETDLSSSGASSFSGDTNLENKSFVVKAFSSFSGLPNATGTNSLIIACGNLQVTSQELSQEESDVPLDL